MLNFGQAIILNVHDPQKVFTAVNYKGGEFKARLSERTGNRTAFIQLQLGEYTWWYPLCFELLPQISILPSLKQEKNKLLFKVVNHSNKSVEGLLSLQDFKMKISLEAKDSTEVISISGPSILAGSNKLNFLTEGKESRVLEIVNWDVEQKNLKQRTVGLSAFFNDKVTQIFRNKYLSPRPKGPTLQLPWQGIGNWPNALAVADIDDSGLRKLAGADNQIVLPQGIRLITPGDAQKQNILFTSQWDNYPAEKSIPLSGSASHAYFLMAGSTNHMQSQFDNGQIVVTYTDGSADSLVLRNPETWWPIQEDYYTDGFAFNLKMPRPLRIHLKTGLIVSGEQQATKADGHLIAGGAATVLDLPLDSTKTLQSLSLKTLANDVVIGLMSITLISPK